MKTSLDIQSTINQLKRRAKDYEDQRDEALRNRNWSHVSGLDGISIGLTIAIRTLEEDFAAATKKAKQVLGVQNAANHFEP